MAIFVKIFIPFCKRRAQPPDKAHLQSLGEPLISIATFARMRVTPESLGSAFGDVTAHSATIYLCIYSTQQTQRVW